MVVEQTQAASSREDRMFHALADATRRDIFRSVLRAEQSVSNLARQYPMSFAAVQKHVAVLERAELVTKRRRGRERMVCARHDAISEIQGLLDELEVIWRQRLERFDAVLSEQSEGA